MRLHIYRLLPDSIRQVFRVNGLTLKIDLPCVISVVAGRDFGSGREATPACSCLFLKLTLQVKIGKVLSRLNSAVPNPIPAFQQMIDSYKHIPLDPAAERRIQTYIEQWRKLEKGLDIDMQLMKKDFNEIKHDVKDITKDVKEMKEFEQAVKELKEHTEIQARDICDMKEDVTTITKQEKEVHKNVEEVKLDVKNINRNIVLMSKDIETVKENVTVVKGVTRDINTVKEHVGEVKKRFDEVKGTITKVEDGVSEVKGHFIKVTEDVNMVRELLKEHTENQKVVSNTKIQQTPGKVRQALKKIFRVGKSKLKNEKGVQDDLIAFYRRQYTNMSLCPLVEEETPLLKFYVTPNILSIKVHRARGGGIEIKTRVAPFGDMFYNNITDDLCHEIYLTANAGLGKTAFCKRLALTWCQAKKPLKSENQYFSKEEIEALRGFRFVFLLLLRDSSSECDIDALIFTQIISQLSHNYTMIDLENILTKETCLVILDGLDEWSHPLNSCKRGLTSIPHRKVRERNTVLTTTRPWKLSIIGLKPSQIDQKLEITGLNWQSANELKRSVISHLFMEEDDNILHQYVVKFTRAVKEKHISDLEANPLLLTYLLFLWYYNIELGESQCDLYCQITEVLLSRTVQIYKEMPPKTVLPRCDIPQCLSEQTYCRQFFTLLTALGKLAYNTLYRETTEENTLDGSVAEQYLSKECLTFCLTTGLITQNKVQAHFLEQKSKVSFAHKTIQEFLAALYMHSSDQKTISEDVRLKCKCISDIPEMSNILKFTRGINADTYSMISCELLKILNEDKITIEYRSTLHVGVYGNPLTEFQDMCISQCLNEPCKIDEVSLCLLDVFIEEGCKQEDYRESLKQLTTRNKQNIRSLYIAMQHVRDTPYRNVEEVIEYFAINELDNVEKIHYEGECIDKEILPLLSRSIKCLSLSCNLFKQGTWSHLLSEKVTGLQNLQSVNISRFGLSYSELTLLYDYISQRHYMREIALWDVLCTDQMKSPGCRLDLSQHTHLRKLTLSNTPLSELNIDMSSLEKCFLQLSNPDIVLCSLNCVPANNKLHTFQCRSLDSPGAIDTLMDTLGSSVHVEYVELSGINIVNKALTLSSEMVHIERVELLEVTMSSSVLDDLVNVVQDLTQRVTVDITNCNFSPEIEFETVKEK